MFLTYKYFTHFFTEPVCICILYKEGKASVRSQQKPYSLVFK